MHVEALDLVCAALATDHEEELIGVDDWTLLELLCLCFEVTQDSLPAEWRYKVSESPAADVIKRDGAPCLVVAVLCKVVSNCYLCLFISVEPLRVGLAKSVKVVLCHVLAGSWWSLFFH